MIRPHQNGRSPVFIRRVLPLALFSAVTIAGSTVGAAIATNSQGFPSVVRAAHPTHSVTAQLDRWFGPGITGDSPDSGPTNGGTTVTITGTGLTVVTEVLFGSVRASYTIVSNNEIIAISPAESAGTVAVSIVFAGGPGAGHGEFTYS
jgi:hypothetical protein